MRTELSLQEPFGFFVVDGQFQSARDKATSLYSRLCNGDQRALVEAGLDSKIVSDLKAWLNGIAHRHAVIAHTDLETLERTIKVIAKQRAVKFGEWNDSGAVEKLLTGLDGLKSEMLKLFKLTDFDLSEDARNHCSRDFDVMIAREDHRKLASDFARIEKGICPSHELVFSEN